jgi:hypothetical protein
MDKYLLKKTKIIATLGPACNNPDTMKKNGERRDQYFPSQFLPRHP